MLEGLTDYLNKMKAELQELYEDLDAELRNTENQNLIDDSYHNVIANLETALSEMDTLVGDISNGVYGDDDGYDIDDDMSEVNE